MGILSQREVRSNRRDECVSHGPIAFVATLIYTISAKSPLRSRDTRSTAHLLYR
jgi:hypothetical protein